MIVSVASGKGGTGKTTVAINLAKSSPEPVQLLDCDVEEPNAHLFLHPQFVEQEVVSLAVPVVDQDRCNGCRKCQAICRFRAITVIKGKVLIFPELCHGCGGCMYVCPEKAIAEGQREIGRIDSGSAGHIQFSRGTLRIGESLSPPLIKAVRKKRQTHIKTIIDAPPGTSCPVISAIRGVDFVVLVTEPTPFGLHDLQLAVEAVHLLKLPAGLVINRSNLGDDRVHQYAKEHDLPILLEIPFDRAIAKACSRGDILVDVLPEYKKNFVGLWRKIYERINPRANQ